MRFLRAKYISSWAMKLTLLSLVFLFEVLKLNAQKKPNVIFIIADQWRSSAFGYAGNDQVKTPFIDTFSNESVSFINCVSVLAKCTPYRAALMTGKYPTTTGMIMNDLYLPEKELCMGEIFKAAGYSTAFYGKWHLDGHGRMDNVEPARRQGFDYWKAAECSHDYNKMPYYENDDPSIKYWGKYSPFAIEEDAEKYLDQASKNSNPFLLFLSLETPHFSKHLAPQQYMDMYPPSGLQLTPNVTDDKFPKLREELQEYYAHCTATDEAIGMLIKKIKVLGLYDNSIIIFSADHGDMMGSHGVRPREKQLAWDEAVKTSFLIRYPRIGHNAGKKTLTPITTPDVLPTLLSLANIRIPRTIEGMDLSSIAKNPHKQKDRAAIFMSVYPIAPTIFSEYRGIKTKNFTYVKTPDKPLMLFNNISDPYEMNNLIGKLEFAKLQNKMEKQLQRELKKIGDQDFKPYQFYLKKFGFSEFVLNKTEVPYSNELNKTTKVYSPKSD